MKTIYLSIALFLFALTMSCNSYGHDKSPVHEGPYVGQKTPGSTPKAFTPSTPSKEYRDGSGFFTPAVAPVCLRRSCATLGTEGLQIKP